MKDSPRLLALALGLIILASCRGAPPDTVAVHRRQLEALAERAPAGSAAAAFAGGTLGAYQRQALQHNAGLRAAFARWQASLEAIPQAGTLPEPVLTFTHFLERVETRTGPQRNRWSLSQAVPWIGVLLRRGDVAAQAAEETWAAVLVQAQALCRDVAVAYHEYAYLGRAIQIESDGLELLKQLEGVVQRQVQTGRGQEDLLRLQVEISQVENQWLSLREMIPVLSRRLASLLELPAEQKLLPVPELVEPVSRQLTTASLQQLVQEYNPELRLRRQTLARRREEERLVAADRWPDLSLGIDYIDTGRARNPGVSGSGDDPLALRMGVTLPLWLASDSAAGREADQRVIAASHEHASRRSQLLAEVELEHYHLREARRQLALHRDTLLPRARETLDLTRSSYRSGRADLLDVIDNERLVLQFETAYWEACRDDAQSQARLEALCGGHLP